ncbi:helix-turn-helix domain-containing protein, partial [Gardnerella pickettii]
APSVTHLPQIIRCDDVLPERALIGDETAVETLYTKVYQSLAPYNPDDPTLQTVDAFLRFGGALDQTSHNLNVHPNTIRYRLRKVAQTTGWDATDPREAYVLQTAITIGRIRDSAL